MASTVSLDGDVTSVKSARRLMLVLEYLAEKGQASFAEIVRDLKLPNSSGHQLLATMVDGGFVEHDERSRSYRLGPRLWAVAQAYRRPDGLAELAQPLMRTLVDEVGETAQLAVLEDRYNVYLAVFDSPHPMRLASAVGRRLPAHATGVGKALLSGLPDAEIGRLLDGVELERFTEQTLTSLPDLMADIELIRARGYGEDNEEFVIGCKCVARPVRDPRGQVVAAMSVTVPTPRLTDELLTDIHDRLSRTVAGLERRMS